MRHVRQFFTLWQLLALFAISCKSPETKLSNTTGTNSNQGLTAAPTSSKTATLARFDMLPQLRNLTRAYTVSSTSKNQNNEDGWFLSDPSADAVPVYPADPNYRVLAHLYGPGSINRFWATDFDGSDILNIYLDGSTTPTLSMPVVNFCNGQTAPSYAPLGSIAFAISGGCVSYTPIPFQSEILVLASINNLGTNMYYQIDYEKYPNDTNIATFTPGPNPYLTTISNQWNLTGSDPKAPSKQAVASKTVTALAQTTAQVFGVDYPNHQINAIQLQIPGITSQSGRNFVPPPNTMPTPEAHFILRNAHSSLVLDMQNPNNLQNGAQITQAGFNGNASQQWLITNNLDGSVTLTNFSSGGVLEVANASQAAGGTVDQWQLNSNTSQQWWLSADLSGNGYYNLKNSNSGMCLDIPYASQSPGVSMQQWPCTENGNNFAQMWSLELVGNSNSLTSQIAIQQKFMFRGIDSGLLLDGSNAAAAQLQPYSLPGGSAVWELIPTNDGQAFKISAIGNANMLGFNASGNAAGNIATQVAADHTLAQTWSLAQTNTGRYTITNVSNGLCLDVVYDGNTAGTAVQQYYCNNGNAQQWAIELAVASSDLTEKSFARSDDARTYTGSSSWTTTINPNNQGVYLRRRLNANINNQEAKVYVNNQFVGLWSYKGFANYNNTSTPTYLRDSEFYIPAQYTANQSQLNIQINALTSWSDFYYWIYTITGNSNGSPQNSTRELDDQLDVGNPQSESAHQYNPPNAAANFAKYAYAPLKNNAAAILNGLNLVINFDDENSPSVNAPLSQLFAMGDMGFFPTRALPVGIDEADNLYLYFPMPFKQNAKIQLANNNPIPCTVKIKVSHNHLPSNTNIAGMGYFKTQQITYAVSQGDPNDVTLFYGQGSGHVVGIVQTIYGQWAPNISQNLLPGNLEGDYKFYVDSSKTPSSFGTGTEDFYNGAGYWCLGQNTGALSGSMYNQASLPVNGNTQFISSAYRFMLGDAVPFLQNLTIKREHGPEAYPFPGTPSNWQGNYDESGNTLVYYYLNPQISSTVTDSFEVDSGAEHLYSVLPIGVLSSKTTAYMGDLTNQPETHPVFTYSPPTQGTFQVKIDPANQGVILRRRLFAATPDQSATVSVNGINAGIWFTDHGNPNNPGLQWEDSEFFLPLSATANQSVLNISIVPLTTWTESRYDVYSIISPNTL